MNAARPNNIVRPPKFVRLSTNVRHKNSRHPRTFGQQDVSASSSTQLFQLLLGLLVRQEGFCSAFHRSDSLVGASFLHSLDRVIRLPSPLGKSNPLSSINREAGAQKTGSDFREHRGDSASSKPHPRLLLLFHSCILILKSGLYL